MLVSHDVQAKQSHDTLDEDEPAPAPPAPPAVAALPELPAEWASVCLCVSGSVAAVKAPDVALELLRHGVSVDLVVTEAAHSLLQASYRGTHPWARLKELVSATAALPAGDNRCASCAGGSTDDDNSKAPSTPTLRLFRDADEWRAFAVVGTDPVLHIELAKRNHLLLIAPLCANTLASAALGLCSNLLLSVLRAWYYDLDPEFSAPLAERYGIHAVNRPVVVAPAMNTFMWHQRITRTHLDTLEARGVHIVPPIAKKLACGDTGIGAMAEVAVVVEAALVVLRGHMAAEGEARRSGRPRFVP